MTANGNKVDGADTGEEQLSQRRINDALLKQLDAAKKTHPRATKEELLHNPRVSALVNELLLTNEAWISAVIAANIRRQPHLRGSSVAELYSAAVTGNEHGPVGGVMNAILEYDCSAFGSKAFTSYLASAIHNALQPTSKQQKTYRRVQARTQPLHAGEDHEPGWVDRTAPAPETVAINRELLKAVQSVIPRLPAQQRAAAEWLFGHILATGERPAVLDLARMQRVSRERGRQILVATFDSIRREIEERYPQLAAEGINGWEDFKKAFDRPSPAPAR